jgi:hypothetical protein
MKLDLKITNSELSCMAVCPRKLQIAYLHHIRPADDATPLRFGKAWHDALDRRAKGVPQALNEGAIIETYAKAIPATPEQSIFLAYEEQTLIAYLRVYDWRWSDMDSTIQTLASEEAFDCPIVNPETGKPARIFTFAGKIDRRVKLGDGRTAVMECKTTSTDIEPESSYWKRLRVDTQIARYVLAMRHLGHPVDTVLYDVIRKPGIKPKGVPLVDDAGFKIVLGPDGQRAMTKDGKKPRATASDAEGYVLQTRPETPDEWRDRLQTELGANPERYFARREIPRTDADLDDAMRDLWDSAQMLHVCEQGVRWPRNSMSCVGFGTCCYLDLCSTGWSPKEGQPIPPGFVAIDEAHAELASP